jgi:HK97 family phage prohead protease
MSAKETEAVKREVGERVKLTLNLEPASTKDVGEGVLEAVITTSARDRHSENIETAGIDTSNYMKNPVVLYGHDYYGLPIGKSLKLTEQKNKIKARFQLAVEEYPFAKTVYDMVKSGYLNAVSIGGIVHKWSDDYRTIEQMEMLEFSIVSIPANPDAMITARSFEETVGKTMDEVSKEYEQFTRSNLLDKLKSLDKDETTEAIRVLKTVVDALEAAAQAVSSAGDDAPEVRRIKRITLRNSAKAAVTQSQRVIKVIKLSK